MENKTAQQQERQSAEFLTISEFKTKVAGNTTVPIQFLERTNKETGLITKFASINGKAFKMQGDLDVTKDVRFLVVDSQFNEGCFVNVKPSDNIKTLFSL